MSNKVWGLTDWTCFIVTAWEVINICVGSRKGEVCCCPADLLNCFTRDCLTWGVAGMVVADPTSQQLHSLAEGDCARLGAKGAKCYQWGMC